MPSINLIAARRADKLRHQQNVRKLIYAIAAEAGAALLIVSILTLQLVTAQGQVSDLNDKIAKLKPQVEKIQTLQAETAQLQPKLTALNEARSNTLYWYTALQNVTNSLSSNAWLTLLQTNGSPAPPPAAPPGAAAPPSAAAAEVATINLTGSAISQGEVGATMLKMNQYPHFSQVGLNFATQALVGKKPVVNFQLTIQMHPADDGATGRTASASGLGTSGLGASNVQKS